MINLELLDKYAKEYKTKMEQLKELKKKRFSLIHSNEVEFYVLKKRYNELTNLDDRDKFIIDNKLLREYEHCKWEILDLENDINKILNGTYFKGRLLKVSYDAYFALKKDKSDDYKILCMNTRETIDLEGMEDYKKEYLIKMLKTQKSFVGYLTRDDLPLLMNIYEENDIPYNFEKLVSMKYDTDIISEDAEDVSKLKNGIIKAHMTDKRELKTTIVDPITKETEEVENELPFIYDSKTLEVLWYRLDEEQQTLSEDEYMIKYYTYLILFANNIEDIYNEASDEYKTYVIEAYQRLVYRGKIRTASPLINEEVLKREYAKIK